MGIIMKVAYVGIDLLIPGLFSLYDCGCEIIKIFTCRTDNVTEFNTQVVSFAGEHDIPLQMDRIKKEDLYDLLDKGCKFVLVGGYYHKIPVIDELPIVNIHPALLPLGRGPWPMPVTILRGLKESGVTMHRMVEALDEGDVIIQKTVPVYPDDDLKGLTKRLCDLIPDMVKSLVSDFDKLWDNAYPQEGKAEYWDLPEESEETVRSDMTFDEADLILRAFYGYECFYIDKDNTGFEIIEAVAKRGDPPEKSDGTILPLSDGYITCERIKTL